MPESIFDLLAEAGIQLRGYGAGHEERVICPKCGGGRSREKCLSVSIDHDGMGATWNCFRGKCGDTGGGRIRFSADGDIPPISPPAKTTAPVPPKPDPEEARERPESLYAWFQGRGISRETVDHFGVYRLAAKGFRDGDGWKDKPAIVFPYFHRGVLVNRKYRGPNKELMQDKNPLPTLFNIDSVIDDDEIIFVEGEPDVMALHEAGYQQVVSLKDGASRRLRDEDDPARLTDKRFAALTTHEAVLTKARRIILAGDMDEPGESLREELARRFGRQRCRIVRWPQGCKDGGDTLKLHGPDAVRQAMEASEPYPVDGLQVIGAGSLRRLRHSPPPPVLTTGTGPTDDILRFPGEGGRLIVITGIPNHGKTPWARHCMIHLMRKHGRKFLVFSPEMQPWEQYVATCAENFIGKRFWPDREHPENESMTDAEIDQAEIWLKARLTMLVSDSEDEPPTLEWILDKARVAVMRDGITDLSIDPWNEIEHTRGNLTETEYVGRALQQLKAFGQRHGVNIWIIAHPTKPAPTKPGEKLQVPGMYSISGGANWANKADIGLAVYRDAEEFGVTQIHLLKSKFSRWGERGKMAKVAFSVSTGRYSTPMGWP